LIQGFTEFLPVSSSGHLALAQIFLGMDMPPLSFDLVLHASTALAVIIFFWRDIWRALFEWVRGLFNSEYRESYGWALGWAVIVGTVITGTIGLLVRDYAERALQNLLHVGAGLCVTGVVLLSARFITRGVGRVSVRDGFFVGLAQGIAVWPGISRSGLTIFAGQIAGLDKEDAFKFSFLLSLPAIFGAILLEAYAVGGWDEFITALPAQWHVGAAVAFCSGLVALAILKRLVISSKWWIFGAYCLAVGVATVIISYMGMW